MYIPEAPLKYKVVSNGALPSAVRPRIEYGIEQLLNREQFTTNQKRFGRQVTTKKTRIAEEITMGQTVAQRQLKKRHLKLTGVNGTVKARQRIEQTIALTAAQALLDAGYLLGVYDGEEITLHHSRDLDKVQAALFTTDEDFLYVYKALKQGPECTDEAFALALADPTPDYWVRFVYGNDGWDVMPDYSSTADLDPIIGEGTVVGKLIGYAEENGIVPDLYNK